MNDVKAQLKQLYSESFNDSKSYIDYYFDRRFNGENAVYLTEGDEIISALFHFDRTMRLGAQEVKSSFISGAATKECLRGRGIMGHTLKKAFYKMRRNQIPIAYLYPFKHAYYKRFGFISYSFMKPAYYQAETRAMTEEDIRDVLRIYCKYVAPYSGYTLRGIADFEEIYHGIRADGGNADVLLKHGKIVGYHFYDSFGELSEFASEDAALLRHTGKSCMIPANAAEGDEYSMARLTDVAEILPYCELTAGSDFSGKIRDDIIEENNLTLRIFERNGKTDCEKAARADFEVDISDLTAAVFGVGEGKIARFFPKKINLNFEKY